MMVKGKRKFSMPGDPIGDRRARISGSERDKWATGHAGVGSRPSAENGLLIENSTSTKQNPENIKVATWNVRTLFESGKLANACQEMEKLKVNILGISETRWPDTGITTYMGKTFYYSGNNNPDHRNGVGILIDEELSRSVKNFVPLSDRNILIQLEGKPINMNIIQTYAPTSDKPLAELEDWYNELESLMKLLKSHDINIVMGDMNAKIGQGRVGHIVGDFGLGERNDRGDRLVEFCQEHDLIVTNTWFKLHPRRLYTWTSPQHNSINTVRNQIDYVLVNQRYRNSVTSAKTYPGADIGSDHNPLVTNLRTRLKTLTKRRSGNRINVNKLKEDNIKNTVTSELNTQLNTLKSELRTNYNNVDDIWNKIKNILIKTTADHLKSGSRTKKKEWMTEEILLLMDRRRAEKGKNIAEYNRINKEIKAKIKTAKESWMLQQCEEIEELQRKNDSYNLHKKVKQIGGHKRSFPNTLLNKDGKLIIEPNEKMLEWERYINDMFNDQRATVERNNEDTDGPTILRDEVIYAINNLRNNRSPGPDSIYSEILKIISEENIDVLIKLFNQIYISGVIPQDWLESTFIPLPKKVNARKCNDYRLISLMSQALKILLKIIHKRIYMKCEAIMGREQFGFRSGLGTREALFSLQILTQKCYEHQKDVYICFIDFEKAFDRVRHEKLFEIMGNLGIDKRDIQLLRNLYWHQTARIKIDDKLSNNVNISKGVRQGCVLSPTLFNVYSEYLFEEALEDCTEGIKINGVNISNIRYADDTALIADSDTGLQNLIDRVNGTCREYGMDINIKKTKIMIITRNQNIPQPIFVNGEMLSRVERFKYLGSWINSSLDQDMEIKSRIEQARSNLLKLRNILCDQKLDIELRIRLAKCYSWSTLLYGVETWTLKINTMNRLEAFEMWMYRKIMKIPYTDHVTNEEVLRRVHKDRELLHLIKIRKTSYLGHVLRNDKYYILQLLIKGRIQGKRPIGRKKLSWLRNIRNWSGLNFEELIRAAEDREDFARVIANLR